VHRIAMRGIEMLVAVDIIDIGIRMGIGVRIGMGI
jgi:hypothetical protein